MYLHSKKFLNSFESKSAYEKAMAIKINKARFLPSYSLKQFFLTYESKKRKELTNRNMRDRNYNLEKRKRDSVAPVNKIIIF